MQNHSRTARNDRAYRRRISRFYLLSVKSFSKPKRLAGTLTGNSQRDMSLARENKTPQGEPWYRCHFMIFCHSEGDIAMDLIPNTLRSWTFKLACCNFFVRPRFVHSAHFPDWIQNTYPIHHLVRHSVHRDTFIHCGICELDNVVLKYSKQNAWSGFFS